MERNLFKYVWMHSRKEQIGILLLVLASLPFYFLSLNVPKNIVNTGIQGDGFDGPGSTQPFFTIELPGSEWLFGEAIIVFDGFMLEQQGMLLALSFLFLVLVLINGLFKRDINTRKGRTGERMLRRLRYQLSDRILRFPLLHMRRVKQSEMATMIKDEVEPLGGFIGDAFVQPAYLGGQAITAMVFIMVQSIWLGLVAAAIVLVQAFIIPRLRRRILVLGRERQLTARALAGRIGELVDGSTEIQAHDTSNFERADISDRLGKIYYIRYEIFKRKFFVKFLNNLLAQFTPFVFYAGGGLLAIYGHLDIGALVAVIAAYKDLPGPIKELIDWDQQRADVQIKYDQVIEQFQPSSILDPELQDIENEPGEPLEGEIIMTAVSLLDDNDFKLLDGVTFSIGVGEHVAVVGPSGSGKEQIAFLLSGLVHPTSGSVRISGRDIENLPSAVSGRRITYIGQDCYHFATSVRENLLYGLKHRPMTDSHYEGDAKSLRNAELAEAMRSGNPNFDLRADWVDYKAAGATGPDDINERLIEMLCLVELEEDVYRFGLTGTINPEENPEAATAILEARKMLVDRLESEGAGDLVVRFHDGEYNAHATLVENLLFGTPTRKSLRSENLADNVLFHQVLDDLDLTDDLIKMGVSIARTMVEIFADLPPGHPFFEQFSFISDDDLPEFRTLLQRYDTSGLQTLNVDEQKRLLTLPFNYVEARHRMGLIDKEMEERLLAARRNFREMLEREAPGAVEFYHADEYNAAADLQDNILFGRIAYGKAQANEVVGRAITEMLDSMGLRDTVIRIGLDYQVGVGGKRLSSVQRQKLGLARALLKQPDLLVVNEAVAVMDGSTQQRLLQKILEYRPDSGIVWTLQRPSLASNFQKIVVMQGGRAVEYGTFDSLKTTNSALNKLMAAE